MAINQNISVNTDDIISPVSKKQQQKKKKAREKPIEKTTKMISWI